MSELEGMRASSMTDAQVLRLLRERATDLRAADALAKLTRVLDLAVEKRPDLKDGLLAAKGLAILLGKNYAPGHEAHPFRDEDHTDVRRVFATVPVKPPRPSPPKKEGTQSKCRSSGEVILARIAPGEVFAFKELREELGMEMADFSNAVYALVNKKILIKISRGRYQRMTHAQD